LSAPLQDTGNGQEAVEVRKKSLAIDPEQTRVFLIVTNAERLNLWNRPT
jgi:hypothetical protein